MHARELSRGHAELAELRRLAAQFEATEASEAKVAEEVVGGATAPSDNASGGLPPVSGQGHGDSDVDWQVRAATAISLVQPLVVVAE